MKGYVFFSSCVSIVQRIESTFAREDRHEVPEGQMGGRYSREGGESSLWKTVGVWLGISFFFMVSRFRLSFVALGVFCIFIDFLQERANQRLLTSPPFLKFSDGHHCTECFLLSSFVLVTYTCYRHI